MCPLELSFTVPYFFKNPSTVIVKTNKPRQKHALSAACTQKKIRKFDNCKARMKKLTM